MTELDILIVNTDRYTQKDYYDDLYNGIWEPTIKGSRLTDGDKLLQRLVVKETVGSVSKLSGAAAKKLAGEASSPYAPSVSDIVLYGLDPTGYVEQHADQMESLDEANGNGYIASLLSDKNHDDKNLSGRNFGDKIGYGFQFDVKTDLIDESAAYDLQMLNKIKALVRSRIASAPASDNPHYQAILTMLKVLDK